MKHSNSLLLPNLYGNCMWENNLIFGIIQFDAVQSCVFFTSNVLWTSSSEKMTRSHSHSVDWRGFRGLSPINPDTFIKTAYCTKSVADFPLVLPDMCWEDLGSRRGKCCLEASLSPVSWPACQFLRASFHLPAYRLARALLKSQREKEKS